MKSTEQLTADILSRAAKERAATTRRRKRTGISFGALALAATLGFGVWQAVQHNQPVPQPSDTSADATTVSNSGVFIPKEEIALPLPQGLFSWAYAFVVYQGNTYCSSQSFDLTEMPQPGLLGEKVGVTTGTDEESYWMEHPEAYDKPFASNIGDGCDIYTVNGYDPSFRLAVVQHYTGYTGETHEEVSGDYVYILDCLNGVTLYTGKDVYTDRLHLRERRTSARWQSHSEWNRGKQRLHSLEAVTEEQWNAFFDALDVSPFEYVRDNNPRMFRTEGIKHLTFALSDGMRVRLWLFADGHVSLDSSWYMVQMNGEAFDVIYQACK